MPSERVSQAPGPRQAVTALLATLPYRFPRRLSSPRARSAMPCQPWRRCTHGVLPRCARHAYTTSSAAWLLAGATAGPWSPSLLTYGTHHGTIGLSLIVLFRHLNVT